MKFADFFQNFTEVNAQSVLTIGTLKVLKNHERNHHFSRAKVPKTAENQRKKKKTNKIKKLYADFFQIFS